MAKTYSPLINDRPCLDPPLALKRRRAGIQKSLDDAVARGPGYVSERGIGEAQGWIQALDWALAKMGYK